LFQLCTGTLIDPDVVLSASHCFAGLPPTITDTWFTLDEVIDADRDGVVDPSVNLLTGTPVTHPLFAGGGASNTFDIAVFLLDEAVTGIAPAELPGSGLLNSIAWRKETFTAVGYGAVRETNRKSTQSILGGWRREGHAKSGNSGCVHVIVRNQSELRAHRCEVLVQADAVDHGVAPQGLRAVIEELHVDPAAQQLPSQAVASLRNVGLCRGC
jgi:hypothetical protein